jgi:hypothetical protein
MKPPVPERLSIEPVPRDAPALLRRFALAALLGPAVGWSWFHRPPEKPDGHR